MRKAGDHVEGPELFSAIYKHLRSDEIPDQAANQMTAEILTHGEDVDSSVERFQENYANFRSKGYCDESAQAMAVESMEEGAEQPVRSLRFARVYGDENLA